MRHIVTISLLAAILVSCTKEEVVAPGVQPQSIVKGVDPMAKGANGDGAADPGTEGEGISDDGDDLNDGEGRRKKKKP